MSRKTEKQVVAFRNVAIAVVVLAIAGILAVRGLESRPTADGADVRTLAQCLKDKGVKMYGATWCSHCQRQKKSFGEAAELINYVECADAANPNRQTAECEKAGVNSYPTWEFALGDRQTGEMSFSDLAARAGCPWGGMEDTDPEEINNRP